MFLMEHYGYIYRIIVKNKESSFDGCTYIGQHKYSGDNIDPTYFGSGVKLDFYKKKYNNKGLIVRGIIWAFSQDQLNELEKLFILIERRISGSKCLNLADGGECNNLLNNKTEEEILEIKRKASESIKLSWTDERKQYHSKCQKERYKNVNERIKTSEDAKKIWQKDGHKEKIINIIKSLKWWNNGIINTRSKECPGDGWKQGRLKDMYNNEYKKNMSIKNKGLKWYNNGIKEVFCKECPEGFISGRININLTDNSFKKMRDSGKGRIWCNNGIKNLKVKGEENIPEGFVKGILIKDDMKDDISNKRKGMIYYNNGIKNIRIKEGTIPPEGFIKGRLSYKKDSDI